MKDENTELKKRVEDLEHQVQDLESRLQLLEDLNLVTPYITIYYTEVFRTLRREAFDAEGMCSFVYRNWVELFSSASLEMQEFEEGSRSSKPLNDMIAKCMQKLGGITPNDWHELQGVRRTRNLVGHPTMDDQKAVDAIRSRWKEHTAYDSLQKVVNFVKAKPKSQRRFT